jgi:hypothetical protein
MSTISPEDWADLVRRVEAVEAANQPNPRGCADPLRDHALLLLPPDAKGVFLSPNDISLIRTAILGRMT